MKRLQITICTASTAKNSHSLVFISILDILFHTNIPRNMKIFTLMVEKKRTPGPGRLFIILSKFRPIPKNTSAQKNSLIIMLVVSIR